MTIENVEWSADKLIIDIYEPLEYGVPDVRRKVEIMRNAEEFLKLPPIDCERLHNLPDNPREYQEADVICVPGLGAVVLIRDYDTDCSSGRYRQGSHRVRGPYRLQKIRKKRKPKAEN